MDEQIAIAVDLGVAGKPLPEILTLRQLVEVATAPPRQIIEGVLHQGCKMVLGGTSKSNKVGFAGPAVGVAAGKVMGRAVRQVPCAVFQFRGSRSHRIIPILRLARELNPDALRRPEGRNKVCTDRQFVDAVLGCGALGFRMVVEAAKLSFRITRATAGWCLAQRRGSGVVNQSAGAYWASAINS